MRVSRPTAPVAALFDICCVLIFVIIGRASHAKGEELAGIASTAWPFLSGLAIGWAASRAWRRPGASATPGGKPSPEHGGAPAPHTPWRRAPDPGGLAPAGVCVWLCTVAFGMVFRVVSGQGTAIAFIVVALAFLGLFLLGWRLVARLISRPAAAS